MLGAAEGWRRPLRRFNGAGLPVVFSPRGTEVAYGDAAWRIGRLWRAALDGAGEAKLLLAKADAALIPCGWSGGGEILFWEDPDFSKSVKADGLPLFRVAALGGEARPLGVVTLVHDDVISWAPGRHKLAVRVVGGNSGKENASRPSGCRWARSPS